MLQLEQKVNSILMRQLVLLFTALEMKRSSEAFMCIYLCKILRLMNLLITFDSIQRSYRGPLLKYESVI